MIPAGLAIFLHLATLKTPRTAAIMGILYALSIAYGSVTLNQSDWKEVHEFHDARAAWKAAYLESHDQVKADRKAGLEIYPESSPVTISDRLHYLEVHHLNMFYQPD
jgi:hypothetical protein